jgi:hypothetical protein
VSYISTEGYAEVVMTTEAGLGKSTKSAETLENIEVHSSGDA